MFPAHDCAIVILKRLILRRWRQFTFTNLYILYTVCSHLMKTRATVFCARNLKCYIFVFYSNILYKIVQFCFIKANDDYYFFCSFYRHIPSTLCAQRLGWNETKQVAIECFRRISVNSLEYILRVVLKLNTTAVFVLFLTVFRIYFLTHCTFSSFFVNSEHSTRAKFM